MAFRGLTLVHATSEDACRVREEADLGEEAGSHSSPKTLIQSHVPLRKGQCYSKDNCSAESFTAAYLLVDSRKLNAPQCHLAVETKTLASLS